MIISPPTLPTQFVTFGHSIGAGYLRPFIPEGDIYPINDIIKTVKGWQQAIISEYASSSSPSELLPGDAAWKMRASGEKVHCGALAPSGWSGWMAGCGEREAQPIETFNRTRLLYTSRALPHHPTTPPNSPENRRKAFREMCAPSQKRSARCWATWPRSVSSTHPSWTRRAA